MQPDTMIPSGLRAALNAAATLQQEANPVAPGPGGAPIKSVAGNLMDAMQSRVNAQVPPPSSDMGQGIGSVLANLKNATPILQGQAEDAKVDQIAQRAAQMMQGGEKPQFAHGGIAHLPVDHHFAEGGIIGYAGPDGSDVDALKAEIVAAKDALYKYGSRQKQQDPEGFAAAQKRYEEAVTARKQAEEAAAAPGFERWAAQAASGQPVQMTGMPQRGAPQTQVQPQDLEQLGVGLPQIAAQITKPPAPAPAPRPAASPAVASGAPKVSGLPTIAGELKEARAAMGESPDIARARKEQEEYAAMINTAPLPGITAIKALEQGAARRDALYAKLDAELPKRQLQALLMGIHRGGLAGGAEAVAQVKNEQAKLEANRIAETQFEAMKLSALQDAQTAFRLGNKKGILEGWDKIAQLSNNQDQIIGNLASHVMGYKYGYEGQKLQAAATERASANRAKSAMEMFMAKSMLAPKLSPSDQLKLEETVQTKFFSPMATQSQEFMRFVGKQPNGEQLLRDIQAGRVKFDPKKGGWGKDAAPVIQRAADAYYSSFLEGVGPIATRDSRKVPTFDEVYSMFGGE